ncbi:MAG: hypothetical protein AB9866_30325 [Syntrophobacteraceae bacterium]
MSRHEHSKKIWILVLCVCLLAGFGCNRSSAPPPNPVAQSQPAPGPPPSSVPSGPRPQILDFPDVPIPSELDIRSKNSNVFQSGSMKMGFITLRGRVESSSVMNFFSSALPREGWRLKGQFRYNRSMLIFDKPDKTCVILITDETIYTYVEIYVAPVVS